MGRAITNARAMTPMRKGRMRLLLLAILLGFPLLEIALLARLAELHGWWVLAWVVLAAVAGVALLKEARFALVLSLIPI